MLGQVTIKIAVYKFGIFLIANLIPVTLGNIIGGGIFVGAVYWYLYIKNGKRSKGKLKINNASDNIAA